MSLLKLIEKVSRFANNFYKLSFIKVAATASNIVEDIGMEVEDEVSADISPLFESFNSEFIIECLDLDLKEIANEIKKDNPELDVSDFINKSTNKIGNIKRDLQILLLLYKNFIKNKSGYGYLLNNISSFEVDYLAGQEDVDFETLSLDDDALGVPNYDLCFILYEFIESLKKNIENIKQSQAITSENDYNINEELENVIENLRDPTVQTSLLEEQEALEGEAVQNIKREVQQEIGHLQEGEFETRTFSGDDKTNNFGHSLNASGKRSIERINNQIRALENKIPSLKSDIEIQKHKEMIEIFKQALALKEVKIKKMDEKSEWVDIPDTVEEKDLAKKRLIEEKNDWNAAQELEKYFQAKLVLTKEIQDIDTQMFNIYKQLGLVRRELIKIEKEVLDQSSQNVLIDGKPLSSLKIEDLLTMSGDDIKTALDYVIKQEYFELKNNTKYVNRNPYKILAKLTTYAASIKATKVLSDKTVSTIKSLINHLIKAKKDRKISTTRISKHFVTLKGTIHGDLNRIVQDFRDYKSHIFGKEAIQMLAAEIVKQDMLNPNSEYNKSLKEIQSKLLNVAKIEETESQSQIKDQKDMVLNNFKTDFGVDANPRLITEIIEFSKGKGSKTGKTAKLINLYGKDVIVPAAVAVKQKLEELDYKLKQVTNAKTRARNANINMAVDEKIDLLKKSNRINRFSNFLEYMHNATSIVQRILDTGFIEGTEKITDVFEDTSISPAKRINVTKTLELLNKDIKKDFEQKYLELYKSKKFDAAKLLAKKMSEYNQAIADTKKIATLFVQNVDYLEDNFIDLTSEEIKPLQHGVKLMFRVYLTLKKHLPVLIELRNNVAKAYQEAPTYKPLDIPEPEKEVKEESKEAPEYEDFISQYDDIDQFL
ncbi:MAG: hypothetical protein LC122_12370 [Chitinophagales bacterium]|nr:hypothetical protein [Chitinophagales bacterium]